MNLNVYNYFVQHVHGWHLLIELTMYILVIV